MSAETSSKFNKLHKKVKLAIGGSKKNKDIVKTLVTYKKAIRGNKNAEVSIQDAVDVSYDNDKLYKKDNSGRRNMRINTREERSRDGYEAKFDRNSGFKSLNSGQKRKRVYADYDKGDERMLHENVDKPKRRALSRDGWNKVKDDVGEDKRTAQGNSRDFERFRKRNLSKGEEPSYKNEVLDNIGSKKSTAKAKFIEKMEVNKDGSRSSLLKRDTQNKSNSSKQFNQNHNGSTADILDKFGKKKFRGKKSLNDGSALDDDQPRKSKRVIRIDRRDVTNKRLDDGIVTDENIKEKKEDLQQNDSAEMSKNAQFRAIQPSPHILSFVEDNLLGRRRAIELRRMGYNTELSAPLDNIPSSTSSERERIEEPIFRNKLEFFAAAKISSSFPPPDLPEIAFAGRSNVGKSSLLNALTRQWGVVRTSDKPGLTQTINFFQLGSKFCLVDLPGYGFAYAKEEVKEAWEELVKEYVSTRVGLKRVCLLVDTKWGMKPRDHELIELMERSQTNYQIVLTKTDLVFPIDVARRAMQIEESLKAKKSAVQPVMMISSKSGAGIRSLRTVLTKIARFVKL